MTSPLTVLFVGTDVCARTPVLQSAGYTVLQSECDASTVVDTLVQSPVDAVLFHCDPEPPSHLIISAARAASDAPIVLFARHSADYNEADYDLLLPPICSPTEWLPLLDELIESHRNPDRRKPLKSIAIDTPQKDHRYNPTR